MCSNGKYAPFGNRPSRMGVTMRVTATAHHQERTYLCPVDVPLTVLGGKWKLLIAFFLLQAPRRNGELKRMLPGISQKMLTQQLRELEADGIIVRTAYAQAPPRVDYAIAESERSRLQPLVDALFDWGVSWARDNGGVIDGTCPDVAACAVSGE
jgi:DNA-binding HxlR family transcriptional regulator